MKKLITLVMVCFVCTMYAQQVDRQKVVLEVGTGTWCPSCPAVVDIIHDLEAEGAEVAVVKYHINDVYENAASVERKNFYDFPWYPTTYYDSDHVGYDDWATYSVHQSMYLARMATQSSFSVALNMETVDETALSGTITIDKVAEYTGQNVKLHVVLTESHIPDAWQGEDEVSNAEREMNNFGQGETIDFSGGDTQELPFSFDIDPTWVAENCQVIFFIQDHDTQEVLQGDVVDVATFLGVADYSQAGIGQIAPNPASNEIAIQTNDFSAISQVAIFDLSGKEVYRAENYANAINVSSLQQGFYMMSYSENNQKKIAKFIKR